MSIRVTIPRVTPTSIIDFGIDYASSRLANAYQVLARRQLRRITSSAMSTADDTVSVGAEAQVIVDGAGMLSGVQIIGGLVNALDAVVKIGDELSAVCARIRPSIAMIRWLTSLPRHIQ